MIQSTFRTSTPTASTRSRGARRLGLACGALALVASLGTGALGSAPADAVSEPAPAALSPTGPYAWAMDDQPSTAGAYQPPAKLQYNSTTSTSATITRTSVGVYKVFFPGLQWTTANEEGDKGLAMVSQSNCKTKGWTSGAQGVTVNVACFQYVGVLGQGEPRDSKFSVGFTRRQASAAYPVSFAYVSNASADSTPGIRGRFNYGKAVTVTHTGPGSYKVKFASRGAAGIPKVTAYGNDNTMCNIKGWGAAGTATNVSVTCFDGFGALKDSQFVLAYAERNALFGDASLHDAAVTNATPGVNWSYRNGSGFLPATDYTISSSFTGIYSVKLKNQTPNGRYSFHLSTIGPAGRNCFASWPDATASGDLTIPISCYQGTMLRDTKFAIEFNARA